MALVKRTFPVTGMSCASCAAHVEKALRKVEGVTAASVNLPLNVARVEYDEALCTPAQLAASVARMGFGLVVEETQGQPLPNFPGKATRSCCAGGAKSVDYGKVEDESMLHYRRLRRRAIGALTLAVPIVVLGMVHGLFEGQDVALWMLTTWSLCKYGREFYGKAWQLLKHGTSNMDTLVSFSTGVAYVFSCLNLFFPDWFVSHGFEAHLYFDSAGVITAFILLGRWLEARAKYRTTDTLRRLMELRPRTVTRRLADATEQSVGIEEIEAGFLLVARPGERIAVDGVVEEGVSNVDESMISGEPVAVEKGKGSRVTAGTVNKNGHLLYRAERVGEDTTLAQIVKMVQEAQGSKVPVQNLVDRIAAVFVPVIVLAALTSFAAWLLLAPENGLTYGLMALVSVLVVACPCSLGLATPTAIIVGVGRGASMGVLIKDAASLEVARQVDIVALDKTGTLTEGRPEVVDERFESKENHTAIFFSLEKMSEHPLAGPICRHFQNERTVAVSGFAALPGKGLTGQYDGHTYFAGSCEWMRENGKTFSREQERCVEKWTEKAFTIVAMSRDEEVVALLALADKVKPSSRQAVQELRGMGLEVLLLTGDNEAAAAAVCGQIGANGYAARLLPAGKADYIKRLQADGHKVAMAGDGINDSAALAQADLSVAMGKGSDIAIETAMMTVLSSDLIRLPSAIRLSRDTVRVIRQNLFWAFFYNIVSVPIAAGVLYPLCGFMLNPMVAGAAMAMSSVSVVCNSLRLSRKKYTEKER